MSFVVHSDKNRVPRYWAEINKKTVFESDGASEVIQWVIDYQSSTLSEKKRVT